MLLEELTLIKRSIHSSMPSRNDDHSRNEISEVRKKNSELEDENLRLKVEVSRLKDEAAMLELRHQESLRYQGQRHEEELKRKEDMHSDNIKNVMAQHTQAVEHLKKIHLDEIARIKDRSNEGQTLDHVLRQIRETVGSVRLIEEQLAQRQIGLDLVREGQFEARERLLADLEAKARERSEFAEAECTFSMSYMICCFHFCRLSSQRIDVAARSHDRDSAISGSRRA